MRKIPLVKCKNCKLEYKCKKVIHYARGKKRECTKFIDIMRNKSSVPVRMFFWKHKTDGVKKKMMAKQTEIEQRKLAFNEGNKTSQVEVHSYIKVKQPSFAHKFMKRIGMKILGRRGQ